MPSEPLPDAVAAVRMLAPESILFNLHTIINLSLRIKVTYFVNGEVGSTLHPEIMSTLRKWLLSI